MHRTTLCSLTVLAAALLSACAKATPTPAIGQLSPGLPVRFPQTPEILALERLVAADSGVQNILKDHPGARVKLRRAESHVTAHVLESREGKWFNISNQLTPEELTVIARAVGRSAETSRWKALELPAR